MRAINGGSKCSTKQEALPWSCLQAGKEQQTLFFFLEMLFVTGPFRGREVHTWHKLTSLMLPVAVLDVWAPFVHPIIQTWPAGAWIHVCGKKKKKKATTQWTNKQQQKHTHTEPGKVLHQGEMLQELEQLLLLGVALRNSEAELNSKVRTESKK